MCGNSMEIVIMESVSLSKLAQRFLRRNAISGGLATDRKHCDPCVAQVRPRLLKIKGIDVKACAVATEFDKGNYLQL